MRCTLRFAIAACAILALTPLRAEEPSNPAKTGAESVRCLDQRERKAEAETGHVVRLGAAMRVARSRVPGTVVRARLCRDNDGLVYVLTVLARDGKVTRIGVDAVKGTLVGGL